MVTRQGWSMCTEMGWTGDTAWGERCGEDGVRTLDLVGRSICVSGWLDGWEERSRANDDQPHLPHLPHLVCFHFHPPCIFFSSLLFRTCTCIPRPAPLAFGLHCTALDCKAPAPALALAGQAPLLPSDIPPLAYQRLIISAHSANLEKTK